MLIEENSGHLVAWDVLRNVAVHVTLPIGVFSGQYLFLLTGTSTSKQKTELVCGMTELVWKVTEAIFEADGTRSGFDGVRLEVDRTYFKHAGDKC